MSQFDTSLDAGAEDEAEVRAVSPLYLPYTSPIPPLYLPYTSPISPLYLPYTSPISPLYLPHTSRRRWSRA